MLALCLVACGGNAAPAAEPADEGQPTAAPEPEAVVTAGVLMMIPEGFEPSQREGSTEFYENADNSSISVIYAAKDSAGFNSITAELLEQGITAGFQQQNFEVELTTNDFHNTEFDGSPAYLWDVSYTLNEIPIRQLQIGIDAPDASYVVLYTNLSADEAHMEAFYESMESIALDIMS